jgi:hypothetical protein
LAGLYDVLEKGEDSLYSSARYLHQHHKPNSILKEHKPPSVDNPPLPDAARHLAFIRFPCVVTVSAFPRCFVVLFSTGQLAPIELTIHHPSMHCLVDWKFFFHEVPKNLVELLNLEVTDSSRQSLTQTSPAIFLSCNNDLNGLSRHTHSLTPSCPWSGGALPLGRLPLRHWRTARLFRRVPTCPLLFICRVLKFRNVYGSDGFTCSNGLFPFPSKVTGSNK